MRRFFDLVLVLALLFLSAVRVSAFGIVTSGDISLSGDAKKQSVTLTLTDIPDDINLKKIKYKAKLDNSSKKLFSFNKKGVIKFDQNGVGTLTTKANSKILKRTEEGSFVTADFSLTPDKKSSKLGATAGSGRIRFTGGNTSSLTIANNFAGDPVLPNSGSNALIVSDNIKALEAGTPFRISFPANAGSCGVGIGGAPNSTSTGPGGSTASFNTMGGVNTFGSGVDGDPLIISFNNPGDGSSSNQNYEIGGLPESLVNGEGMPGFAQFYEGANASGQVLVSINGTVTIDTENEKINLTTPEGIVISYSTDGTKDITTPASLSELVSDVGGLDAALGFLSGGSLPITIPASIINSALSQGLSSFSQDVDIPNSSAITVGPTNVSVNFLSDITGNLTQTASNITGSFSGMVDLSFDLADAGTQNFLSNGVNNFTMTFDADAPAALTGFTLSNAISSFSLSGGTGLVSSVTGFANIQNPSINLASGINGNNVSITGISTIPSIDEIISNSGGATVEQCVSECTAQGGDANTCQTACEADPNNPQIPGGNAGFEECLGQCTAQGGDAATCQSTCQQQFPQ